MYHVRFVAGEERIDVQFKSTWSPTEYRGLPPEMTGPRWGSSAKKIKRPSIIEQFFLLKYSYLFQKDGSVSSIKVNKPKSSIKSYT